MKNLWFKVTGCLIAASVSLMATGPRATGAMFTAEHNEIVAVESPPFYTNQRQTGGMAFEIVSAALNSEKETATLTTYPVQKMVDYYLTQDKVLGALGTNWKLSAGEKKRMILLPVAFLNDRYYYYKPHHPKGIAWGGKLSNLKGLRYGTQESSDVSAYAKAGIQVVYGRPLSLFQKLKEGSVDFVKEADLSAQAIIESNFAAEKNQFGVMEPDPEDTLCTVVFNLQNPQGGSSAQKFKKGVTTILKNGQYQAIIEKYEGKSALITEHVQRFKILWEKERLRK